VALFQVQHHLETADHRRIYAAYELAYTIVDFSAAILFLVGSVLFFYKALEDPAIWCFVVGSACFALKPTLRLARELHYVIKGRFDTLAERAES
jgi:hypothetical protein